MERKLVERGESKRGMEGGREREHTLQHSEKLEERNVHIELCLARGEVSFPLTHLEFVTHKMIFILFLITIHQMKKMLRSYREEYY